MMATTNRTVPTMHWKQQLSALTQNLISPSYKPYDVDAGLRFLLWETSFRIPGFSGFRKLILNMKDMLCNTTGSQGKHSGTQWNVCTRGKWVLEVPVNQLGPGSASKLVQNWYSHSPVKYFATILYFWMTDLWTVTYFSPHNYGFSLKNYQNEHPPGLEGLILRLSNIFFSLVITDILS